MAHKGQDFMKLTNLVENSAASIYYYTVQNNIGVHCEWVELQSSI